jgi:hypothetical protein
MKLISFKRREDCGTELYVQVLYNKRWALLQSSVSYNDYASWPFFQVRMGMGSLLSLMVCVYKLGFDMDIFSNTWNFECLNELDGEEE